MIPATVVGLRGWAQRKKKTPEGTLSLNPDGSFLGQLKAQSGHGFSSKSYFSVYYIPSSGTPVASNTASQSSGKTTGSAVPSLGTSVLNVALPYCDQSPQYSYSESLKSKTVDLKATVMDYDPAHPWSTWLNDVYNPTAKAADSLTGLTPSVEFSNLADPSVGPVLNGAPSDSVNSVAGSIEINDAGSPLLAPASGTSFGSSSKEAQRLIIRSMYGPNVSRLACDYAYLAGKGPTVNNGVPGPWPNDLHGNPEDISKSPTGHAVDLLSANAPQYYLFNIVRWTDAGTQSNPVAQPASAAQQPAAGAQLGAVQQPASTSQQPYYQADSEWYLLNFSDAREKHRDISKAFQKLPTFDQGTLELLGSNRVLFIGIHLAPPGQSKWTPPTTAPGIPLLPTEQAWYDNVSISYKFTATSVDPVNVADLKSLIGVLLGTTQSPSTGGAALQNAASPTGGTGGEKARVLPPPQPPPGTALANALTTLASSCKLACFLSGNADKITALATSLSQSMEGVTGMPQDVQNSCATALTNLKAATSLSGFGTAVTDPTFSDCLNGAVSQQQLTTTVTDATTTANAIAGALKATTLRAQVYSTYQGLYAAGLINNLAQLPTTSFSAANITGTWTASFNGSSPVPISATQAASNTGTAQTSQAAAGNNATACSLSTSSNGAKGALVQSPCTNTSASIHDESLSFWDISVAVPVKGFSNVTYQQGSSSSPNSVAPSAGVTKENAFGMFDFFPFKTNLYSPPVLDWPYLAVGLPFSGKVFDKPYFAYGLNFNITSFPVLKNFLGSIIPIQIRPMGGWVWNKEFKTIPASGSAPASTVFYRRAWDPQFAIQISIASVASKLTGSSSRSKSGSSSGGTSNSSAQ